MLKNEIRRLSDELGRIVSWATLIIGAGLIIFNIFIAVGFLVGMLFAWIVGKKHRDWIEKLI